VLVGGRADGATDLDRCGGHGEAQV
jgi:hypothetical protein